MMVIKRDVLQSGFYLKLCSKRQGLAAAAAAVSRIGSWRVRDGSREESGLSTSLLQL